MTSVGESKTPVESGKEGSQISWFGSTELPAPVYLTFVDCAADELRCMPASRCLSLITEQAQAPAMGQTRVSGQAPGLKAPPGDHRLH